MSFGQHQAFIDKLDSACVQQSRVLAQARAAAEQRKALWLKQQQKRKAVEMLIDKNVFSKPSAKTGWNRPCLMKSLPSALSGKASNL